MTAAHPAPSPFRHAARTRGIDPFHAVAIFREAMAMPGSLILSVGEPDFPTPAHVIDAAVAAMRRGETHYTVPLGIPELRNAIAQHYQLRYAVSVPSSRVIVTVGASAALTLAFAAVADPGDDFLMADPGYPSNRAYLELLGAKPALVPVSADERFQLTAELVEAHWTDRTRGVLVASPANPTGTTIPHAELTAIADVVRSRGGTLIVDEIYHGLTYGHQPPTAVSLGEDVWVVNSFSKYYCMTGWRLGWLIVPPAYLDAVERMAQHLYIAAPTPSQWAGITAMEPASIAIYEAQRAELEARRDFVIPALAAAGLPAACIPDGAFYAYVSTRAVAPDSWTFAQDLLRATGVALTPGRDFGTFRAEDHVRVSFACPRPVLEEAVHRIADFIGKRA